MSSVFESTVKRLVKEIGDKELKPIKGFVNANKIRQFSLIRRKKAHSWFWQLPDVPLDASLMDILEPSVVVLASPVEVSGHFIYNEVRKQHVDGGVDAGAEASISEETTECQGSSINYKIVSTPCETWTDLQKRKVRDPEPPLLEQCRRTRTNLYVVTDVVELSDSCVMEDRSTGNFSGKTSFVLNTFVKVKGEGGALKVTEKKHTVPKGSVLAYKRKQLVFKKNSWDILHVAKDEEETFPVVEVNKQDFNVLQKEVSKEVNAMAQLSKDVKRVVFSNILDMLGDREALQDLMDTEPLGDLDGPGGTILNELRKNSGSKYLILYLLEAMMVLSDVQHRLLAMSMEKWILSQQRDLVKSILEPNFRYSGSIPFTLKPELLAPLQGEGLAITYELLAECGLKMELHSPESAWDLEAKKPLSALYGTLSVLQQLAEA